ncbi:hypothetical protein CBU03nite_39280 [Clostridium butyricum]|nr:hypothetical protein Cbu04g_00450 [Clostridium butyricum]GEQ18502.1 hypothetical protein CBU01nite_31380 [Clostridium butyricum]GEQ27505.1 hypothetical protein CBU03nite_39280 [Clostridium butyricum]
MLNNATAVIKAITFVFGPLENLLRISSFKLTMTFPSPDNSFLLKLYLIYTINVKFSNLIKIKAKNQYETYRFLALKIIIMLYNITMLFLLSLT